MKEGVRHELEDYQFKLVESVDILKGKIFQHNGVLEMELFEQHKTDLELVCEVLLCSHEPDCRQKGELLAENLKSAPEIIEKFQNDLRSSDISVSEFKGVISQLIENTEDNIDFSKDLPPETIQHLPIKKEIFSSFQELNKFIKCIDNSRDCLVDALEDQNKEEEIKGHILANLSNIATVEERIHGDPPANKEISELDIKNYNSIGEHFATLAQKVTNLSGNHILKSFLDHDLRNVFVNLQYYLSYDQPELYDQLFGNESGITKQKLIVAKYGLLFLLSEEVINAEVSEKHIPTLKDLARDFSLLTQANKGGYLFRHKSKNYEIQLAPTDFGDDFPDAKIPLSAGRAWFNGIENTAVNGEATKAMLRIAMSEDKDSCSLELLDNGKGLDTQVIKEKALKEGLITEEQANNLNEEDLFNLVTEPYFSGNGGTGKGLMKSSNYELKLNNEGLPSHFSENGARGAKLSIKIPLNTAQKTISKTSKEVNKILETASQEEK